MMNWKKANYSVDYCALIITVFLCLPEHSLIATYVIILDLALV